MNKHSKENANKLINEKSPYLLQHAYNPVDWHAWNSEAFEKALKEDKPIFLSIGYSTCHWCHVMEAESFEDQEVAKLLNEVFVSIKVDREERPDIDNIYMKVCHMMTGGGGWPLSLFLTPDKKPFFAATYIPKETRYGRIGMMELIVKIKDLWSNRRHSILNLTEKIMAFIKEQKNSSYSEATDNYLLLDRTFQELKSLFDEKYGGFGQSPKFPTPHSILFLLRYWKRTGSSEAMSMVEKTLKAMAEGGIYDHIGFGFHRYSTDSQWLVPHFEKMLYDQALISMAYLEAYQATKKPLYAKVARETLSYVLRELRDKEGAFYCGEDADSEGEEGKFYVWTEDEIRLALDHQLTDIFISVFGVTMEGNFLDEVTKRKTGTNILHRKKSLNEIASQMAISTEKLTSNLEESRKKLFFFREKRIHPHKDDKVLTDWNGLIIAALAMASKILDEPDYADAARQAAYFILKTLRTPDGRLLHRYREGDAGIQAHIDDYAFLIYGLLNLYEATFEVQFLKTAFELNGLLITHFWDQKNGAFYFTADDGEKLIMRQKEIYDGAIPSGNSIAMLNLLRLSKYTNNINYEQKASMIINAFYKDIQKAPSAYIQMMINIDFLIGPNFEVVIAGYENDENTMTLIRTINEVYFPNKVIMFRPLGEVTPEIVNIAAFTKDHKGLNGQAAAYICIDFSCQTPIGNPKDLLNLIEKIGKLK